MNNDELYNLITAGENERVEFKKASVSLPSSLWETYSAFANTDGGTIILGVSEQKDCSYAVSGVKYPQKVVKEFWNQVNNTQKVSINILLNNHVRVLEIEEKSLVVINVPRAVRQERPVYLNNNILTGTFRRNADGDYHCSNDEVKAMLRDQSEISADYRTFSEVSIDELKTDTLQRYRIRFRNFKPQHVWNNIGDDEFLLKLGAVRRENNSIMPTLAGIVVFAEEPVITSVLPNYFLDYREKSIEENMRWDDRVCSNTGTWSGNIYDFYFLIANKITNYVKLPFILKGMDRIDSTPLHEAIREAVANAVIHADYHEKRGIVIEKYIDTLSLSNPGNFRIPFSVANEGGISDPRNSTIFKIFFLVGVGERAGSGISSINHIFKENGFEAPRFTEIGNPVGTHLELSWVKNQKSSVKTAEEFGEKQKGSVKTTEEFGEKQKGSVKTKDKIIELMRIDSKITIPKLSKGLNITTRAVEKQIVNLKIQNRIKRVGPDKGGHWEVLE